ncbi:MAG: hypothetical protein ACR2JV_00700, partial [Gaiellales bacterium]
PEPEPAAAPPPAPVAAAEPEPEPEPAASAPPAATPPADRPAGELRDVWDEALSRVSPKLRSMLMPATPLRVERGAVVIAFPSANQFQKSQADREQNRHELAAALTASLGADVRVVLETADDGGPPPPMAEAPAPLAPAEETAEADDADPHTREEAFVRNLVETLDASEEEIA